MARRTTPRCSATSAERFDVRRHHDRVLPARRQVLRAHRRARRQARRLRGEVHVRRASRCSSTSIELPGGRLQALSIAWDSRSKSQNGQRWFHLYPNERVTRDDELHWSRPSQNWNFMCADCHSTGLRKNYDRDADRFDTQWSEISVGCEACHGPGSRHVAWASARRTDRVARRTRQGSDCSARRAARRCLDAERDDRQRDTVAPANQRARDRDLRAVSLAARQIADGYEAGKPFLDYYRPALLSRPLYHADGQQRDEVYTWGSFLQSKMYAHGVTCSDCHNPHSGKLRAEGNAVCATCHLPAKYDTPAHHHHQAGERGRVVRGLSHADDHLHGGRPAARSQPAHAATGSVRRARHARTRARAVIRSATRAGPPRR